MGWGESHSFTSSGQWGLEAIDEHDQELDVQLQDTWDHCLELLEDPTLKEIARLKLDGHLNTGIANKLAVHTRTVERKLAIIRSVWKKTWPND